MKLLACSLLFHLRFGLLMVDKSTDHENLIAVELLNDRSLRKQVSELILFPYHRNKLRHKKYFLPLVSSCFLGIFLIFSKSNSFVTYMI